MGDSGKLRFYELEYESKMWLLKTHSHNSNGLAMEPGTPKRKEVEENADPTTREKSPIENLPRAAGVAGGAEKALEPTAYRRCGGGGQERLYAQPITEKVIYIYGEASPRRCGGKHGR